VRRRFRGREQPSVNATIAGHTRCSQPYAAPELAIEWDRDHCPNQYYLPVCGGLSVGVPLNAVSGSAEVNADRTHITNLTRSFGSDKLYSGDLDTNV
jgi:hypothetical protein